MFLSLLKEDEDAASLLVQLAIQVPVSYSHFFGDLECRRVSCVASLGLCSD